VGIDLNLLFAGLRKGEIRSASQMMTLIENESPESEAAVKQLYALPGKALVIGVTGWPGVGKSSLINRIAKAFLDQGKRVGVIAVDPTSPFSGGSLLADRVRFKDIEGRENLFVRSVASRGHHGGLSRSARAFTKVMEVMGCEVVLLETVGTGQDQVTVSLIADTTLVVVAPGLGDQLQAIKAGILEIGDIFVVNKADRQDADKAVLDLENAVGMRVKEGWCPSVVKTVAADGSGISELINEIRQHAAYCADAKNVLGIKIRAAKNEIREAVKSRLLDRFFGPEALKDEATSGYAQQICERRIDPYLVADMILEEKGIGRP
jgi:LAO/AO transport system kinase